jgi:ubiquitin-protein ligase
MYCIVCEKLLENETAYNCGSEECEFISRTVNVNDDYVSNHIRESKQIAEFKLRLSFDSFSVLPPADFSPCPNYLGQTQNDSYNLLKENIPKDFNAFWNKVRFCENDKTIENKYGLIIYGWIKFTFKSNLLSLSVETSIKIPNKLVIRVEHPTDYSSRNTDDSISKNRLYFHGSNYQNWYSIINNGLKNYSGTKKCVNGSSYGHGIYLASDCELSLTYARGKRTLLAVCEIVCDDVKKYRQSNGSIRGPIYVVPNEQYVKIRYILCDVTRNTNVLVNNLFSETVVKEKVAKKQVTSKIKNKRMMKELSYFKNNNIPDMKIDFNDENMYIWTAQLKITDTESDLYKDLQKIGKSDIDIEIRYPDAFPLAPPFIRIISPRFVYRTGHITLGGSICMELLTNQGWSPAYSVENVLVQIKSVILGGEGRVDMKRHNIPYTYSESIDAFKRMLLSHGWS